MNNPEDLTNIVIADFGLATFDQSICKDYIYVHCGTPGYIAPEVLYYKEDQLDNNLLKGKIMVKIQLNKKCEINFEILERTEISEENVNLIRVMLSKNPLHRPSALECLNHSFLNKNYIWIYL
ncbi:protein kinase domain protein [Ichthyophthirius multifiliis]|uniref:Protein kinase domain protein n=1 Tax=Ichthyophthirius multifiliis TaxID=5932 RepID=G0R340_ICHMU|nr:protein kinase domain protein [Ichthyophthirius multifiliis]EGR28116.1 protein kinase domain protein [Ichthyophthirius multifiliis]|eukprot:XP_004027461.1 protein kinase domain protein [Ichthyophthirius multifiliis]